MELAVGIEFTKIFTVSMGWLVGCCDYFVLREGMDRFPQTRAQQWEVGGDMFRKKSPTDWVKSLGVRRDQPFCPFFFVERRRFADQSWRVISRNMPKWKRNPTHIFGGQLWMSMSHKWGWFQSDNFLGAFLKWVFQPSFQWCLLPWETFISNFAGLKLNVKKNNRNTGGIMQTCNVLVLHGTFF